MQSLTYKRALFLLGIVAVLGLGIGAGIGIVGGFNDSPQPSEPADTSSQNTQNQSSETSNREDQSRREVSIPTETQLAAIQKMRDRLRTDLADRFGTTAANTISWLERSACGQGCIKGSTGFDSKREKIKQRWAEMSSYTRQEIDTLLGVEIPSDVDVKGTVLYWDETASYFDSSNDKDRMEIIGAMYLVEPDSEGEKWGSLISFLIYQQTGHATDPPDLYVVESPGNN